MTHDLARLWLEEALISYRDYAALCVEYGWPL